MVPEDCVLTQCDRGTPSMKLLCSSMDASNGRVTLINGIDDAMLRNPLGGRGWPLALQAHPFCLQKGTAKKPRSQRIPQGNMTT